MDHIRLRRLALWSAGASDGKRSATPLWLARRGVPARQSAVAAALCRRTPKVLRVTCPQDSSVNAFDKPRSLETMDLDGGAERCGSMDRLCGTMDARIDFTERNEGRTKAFILPLESGLPANVIC